MDKFEGEDLYSFDNSSNKLNDGETSFDLNSFSSRSASNSQDPNPKKRKSKTTKKQKTMKIILTAFLVCLITGVMVVGAFLFYAFTMVDATMDEDLNNLALNFTTTV